MFKNLFGVDTRNSAKFAYIILSHCIQEWNYISNSFQKQDGNTDECFEILLLKIFDITKKVVKRDFNIYNIRMIIISTKIIRWN